MEVYFIRAYEDSIMKPTTPTHFLKKGRRGRGGMGVK
jgi:hypothetical protein